MDKLTELMSQSYWPIVFLFFVLTWAFYISVSSELRNNKLVLMFQVVYMFSLIWVAGFVIVLIADLNDKSGCMTNKIKIEKIKSGETSGLVLRTAEQSANKYNETRLPIKELHE